MVHFKIELDFSLRRKKAETDRKISTTGMAFAEAEAAAARAARRFKTAANYLTAARSLFVSRPCAMALCRPHSATTHRLPVVAVHARTLHEHRLGLHARPSHPTSPRH